MSQRINHRREGKRYQDNGPRWESPNPMAGCNSTHVARGRAKWRKIRRRKERRQNTETMGGQYMTSRCWGGGGKALPTLDKELEELAP